MQCGSKDRFEPPKEKVIELKWPIQKFRDKIDPLVKLEGRIGYFAKFSEKM
jgi:hypothetical protein